MLFFIIFQANVFNISSLFDMFKFFRDGKLWKTSVPVLEQTAPGSDYMLDIAIKFFGKIHKWHENFFWQLALELRSERLALESC